VWGGSLAVYCLLLARGMARAHNEYAADLVREHPGRFGFFAKLTLPDLDWALDELAYAYDDLGADGIVLHANCKGLYLGDPAFDALFDELDRRRSVIFVHPSTLPGPGVPGIPAYAADFLLDTVRAALYLSHVGAFTAALDQFAAIDHEAVNRTNAELLFPRLS
jgi:predicted TIM-barrel fold metal-dependent hydrolase